jgi:hypothetical protein
MTPEYHEGKKTWTKTCESCKHPFTRINKTQTRCLNCIEKEHFNKVIKNRSKK